MQEEIFRYCLDSKNVLLLGDFNSRCKKSPDYIRVDEHMCDIYGLQDLFQENTNILNYFDKFGIPLDRNSADQSINSYGYNLLDFCKNNNLFILNGRIGNDCAQPQLTCKNSSTVDYFISSAHVMPNILDFHVHEFSPLYSDAHCPVALTLNTEIIEDPSYPENNSSMSKPKLWNSDKSESFINNIDILKVA